MAKTDQDKLMLEVTARELVGKKVKKLRREGKIPGNIYGEDFVSKAVTIDATQFAKLFRHAGETHVVYLQLDKEEVPVLVHNVQTHPVNGATLHIDLRKVNLKKKIEANVPVVLVGESEAVAKKNGVLLTLADTLTVEALPDALPDHIEIDISKLVEINDEIKVSDLPKNEAYEIKEELDKLIVRVSEHKEEEITPQVEAAPEPEVVGGTPVEGEVAATEGEEKPEADTDKKPQEGSKPESQKKE